MNKHRRSFYHPLHPWLITLGLVLFGLTGMMGAASEEELILKADTGLPLNQVVLEVWSDPDFQKRFAESYLAETEIEPKVPEEERSILQKALELMSADKIDEATKILEKEKSQKDGASAVIDFTLGNIYFQQEHLEKAIGCYQIAVEKFPKFRRAWKNLGLIFVRQGEFVKALPALTRVVELGGGDAVTYGLLGYAYSSVENNLAAESAYRMAILLDPNSKDWQMGLARSLFKQERFAEAASLCGKMIVEHPDHADLWLLQANAYIGMNQPLKAAENYELVDRMGKSTVESLNMLGDIYINDELYEMAVDSYIRAIDRNPDGPIDRPIRAAKILTVRGALSETKRLVEHIERVFADRIKPGDHKELLKLRARIAVAEGSGEDEVHILEEIVELDPLDGEALILLGQHQSRKGDNEKAKFYYERAASIEKYEADAKVRHAQLLVGEGKYNEALELLRRAQQLKPRDNIQKYMEQVERVANTR